MAAAYSKQIDDMIERKVARKLEKEEIVKWKEPTLYISHLAVISPKSASTPIRIVFNSSELHKGISPNNCLAKGPDTYAKNILGLLLRWRKDKVAMVGDIKKCFILFTYQKKTPTVTYFYGGNWTKKGNHLTHTSSNE